MEAPPRDAPNRRSASLFDAPEGCRRLLRSRCPDFRGHERARSTVSRDNWPPRYIFVRRHSFSPTGARRSAEFVLDFLGLFDSLVRSNLHVDGGPTILS